MIQGMEKLPGYLSLGGNLFWMMALHSSVRLTVSHFSVDRLNIPKSLKAL